MHRDADASKMITEAIRVTQQLVRDYPLAPKYRALLVELFVNHSATTSDVELARDPTLFEAALRLADENITRARHVPEYRLDYVKIHNNYAAHKYELGDWTGVEQILGKNEAQARSLVEEHGQVPEYHRQVIWLLHTRAKAREKINKLELAENDTRDALAHARRLVEILPKSAAASVELAGAHHQLGRALRNRSQHKDALVQLDEALRMLRPLYDKKSLSYAGRYQLGSTYLTHGSTRYDLKDFSGALESFQHGDDVLQAELKVSPKAGPPHDALALVYRNRGVVFTAMKQVDKADQAYRRSIVLQDRLFKEVAPEPNYGHTLMLHTERFFFFTLDYRPKRLGELEPILRRAVEVGEEIVKRDPKRKDYREYLGLMCNALGNILVIGNRFGEAEKFVLRMAEVGEELTRQDGTNRKYQEMRQQGWNNVVLVASATENDALLIKAAERLVALNPANVDELNGLAWYLATCRDVKLRDPARAIKLSEQSIAGLERESKDKAKLGDHYGTLGAAYCRNGQHALAVAKLARALELRPNDAATVTFNHYYLALSHWKLDDKKKAQEAYDVALKSIEKLTPNDEQHRAHLTRLRAEIAELLGIRLEPKKN
jgi:tetratricopeptide (TPR) repeat protein